MTDKSSYPILPPKERTLSAVNKLDLRDFLPRFNQKQQPPVFIQNTRFDALHFQYEKPYVLLGQAGFLVDYGYRLGYFLSTWQGQINLSLRFQDLKQLLQLAEQRTRQKDNFNYPQLGLWNEVWLFGGEDSELVIMLEKMYKDMIFSF